METVTSARNPLLQDVRRAVRQGGLTQEGCVVAEGPHLLAEALRSGCGIGAVLTRGPAPRDLPPSVRSIELTEPLFRGIASTEQSQGVIALVHPPRWSFGDLCGDVPLVLALDGIQDPGNAGTIVRAAEAFGAGGIVFLKGSVNPYNPKCVRASAGSLFRVPLLASFGEADFLEQARARDLPIYAALPGAARAAAECDFHNAAALVIGSEGRGVSASIRARAQGVSIPTRGVESLNAGIAASILLYEARRQRDGRHLHEPV